MWSMYSGLQKISVKFMILAMITRVSSTPKARTTEAKVIEL